MEIIDLEGEIWKSIPGWEDRYQASSLGRIRSIERTDSMNRKKLSKILKFTLNKNTKYLQISFYVSEGKVKTYRVHRLIALTFIPNLENKPTVNHKNSERTDNKIINLEWASTQEQINHTIFMKRKTDYGENNYHAKITEKDIVKIFELWNSKRHTQKSIGKIFNLSVAHIGDILNGKRWKKVKEKYHLKRNTFYKGKKLIDEDIVQIHELYKTNNYTLEEIAKIFNVSDSTIWDICNRKRYKILIPLSKPVAKVVNPILLLIDTL